MMLAQLSAHGTIPRRWHRAHLSSLSRGRPTLMQQPQAADESNCAGFMATKFVAKAAVVVLNCKAGEQEEVRV